MTLPQHEHPAAVAEFDDAVLWYEDQEPGIGMAFMECAESARLEIATWPHSGALSTTASDGTLIRSKRIRRFPYRIIYAVDKESILILAYAHQRRKPGYWFQRQAAT